jgi:DNA-binding NtrC family response regulator
MLNTDQTLEINMACVLLADDEASVRDMVKRALVADGHDVTVAQDGQEALDLVVAAATPFDVLMSDIQMPALDGVTLATKAVALMPKLKVVLMSAYIDQLAIPDDVKPHVTQVLAKPLALEQARAAIKAAMG